MKKRRKEEETISNASSFIEREYKNEPMNAMNKYIKYTSIKKKKKKKKKKRRKKKNFKRKDQINLLTLYDPIFIMESFYSRDNTKVKHL